MAQLAQAVRFQARGRLLGKPTIIPLGERSKMLATVDSAAAVLAAYANPPDFIEWQVWRRFLRPGDTFVDVGANIGTYSVLAAEVGADVIAVEPNPDNAERIRVNLGLNDYKAEIWPVVLTDSARTVHFSTDQDSENHITEAGENTAALRGEPFDALVGDRQVRGMKIDVEGAEHQVLLGARRALAEGRVDLLQLEWNDCSRRYYGESRGPAAGLLAEYGYELYRPDRAGRLRPSDGEEGRDLFAARPETVGTLIGS